MTERALALSLWQPWASLIAIGAKKIETRSWYTPYRGKLYIHAAKTKKHDQMRDLPLSLAATMKDALGSAPLPYGAIVAVCDLAACRRVGGLHACRERPDVYMLPPAEPELSFGNYDHEMETRYGWMLGNIRALTEPVSCNGAQGLWAPPDDVTALVTSRLEDGGRITGSEI